MSRSPACARQATARFTFKNFGASKATGWILMSSSLPAGNPVRSISSLHRIATYRFSTFESRSRKPWNMREDRVVLYGWVRGRSRGRRAAAISFCGEVRLCRCPCAAEGAVTAAAVPQVGPPAMAVFTKADRLQVRFDLCARRISGISDGPRSVFLRWKRGDSSKGETKKYAMLTS